jgi:hypothetical protein
MSTTCYRHPNREARFYCEKDGNYMCRSCACCRSPRIYCQFRSACLIHVLTKAGELPKCEDTAGREANP